MSKKEIPCRKDCPDRSDHCHADCEVYKAFRAKKDAERDARSAKTYVAWQIKSANLEKWDRWRRGTLR